MKVEGCKLGGIYF